MEEYIGCSVPQYTAYRCVPIRIRGALKFRNINLFNIGDDDGQVMLENYPPVEEGFLRCATVQSEAMLAKLLSEGTYQPSRSELSSHSMTAGCPKCEDDAQWCWHEAYTWMYEQCAERLNMPEMDAGVWLYAHEEEIHNFKEAYNHESEKEGMVLLIVDIPRDRIIQSDWILFHRIQQNYPVRSSETLRVDCAPVSYTHLTLPTKRIV